MVGGGGGACAFSYTSNRFLHTFSLYYKNENAKKAHTFTEFFYFEHV